MAIVKFVADKNCLLFIDMKLVGHVVVGEMLKTSLDVGSYLVEVKEENGNRFGKYKLSINPSDAQVLENLSERCDDIDAIISEMKNDSSLRFYHQRALFCYNGNYGYINTQYKIAIEPIYSYAENFVNSCTLVKRHFSSGEEATIIDINGNICFDRWYDFIGSGEKTVLLKSENTFYVLSKADYSIINQYLDAKYDGKGVLIPVHKHIGVDDMYGYIDKTGTEAIPFIFDYVWNFEETGFAKVKRFGVTHAVGKDGTLFYNMEQAIKDGTTITRERGWLDEPGESDVIVEVYEANKLSKEESVIEGFGFDLLMPMKKGNYWVLYCSGYDDYLRENDDVVECDRIFYSDDHYCAFRSKGICKLLIYSNNSKNTVYSFYADEYIFNADEIIVNFKTELEGYCGHDTTTINNVIIKKNKKYGIVDLEGRIILPIEYDLITTTEAIQGNKTGVVGIVWKDGNCSFVWMSNGKILEPFKYEDIIVNNADGRTWLMWSTYLVKENGKYGCIDFERKPILPSKYDAIDFKLDIDSYGYHYKMLLYNNGKVGTYEYRNYRSELNNYHETEMVFSVEPEYDECVFLKHKDAITNFAGMSYVAVREKDKWGIIDNKPVGLNYYYDFNDRWRNSPNLKKLKFKYNSLEELKNDADAEFERRRDSFYNQHH